LRNSRSHPVPHHGGRDAKFRKRLHDHAGGLVDRPFIRPRRLLGEQNT
jgi:hypothetical protein